MSYAELQKLLRAIEIHVPEPSIELTVEANADVKAHRRLASSQSLPALHSPKTVHIDGASATKKIETALDTPSLSPGAPTTSLHLPTTASSPLLGRRAARTTAHRLYSARHASAYRSAASHASQFPPILEVAHVPTEERDERRDQPMKPFVLKSHVRQVPPLTRSSDSSLSKEH